MIVIAPSSGPSLGVTPPSQNNMFLGGNATFGQSRGGSADRRSQSQGFGLTRRRSTFRQTTLQNALQTKREAIHRPLTSRDFPQPMVPSIGIVEGFLNFCKCDNSITAEKPPCTDTVDEFLHMRLMNEEEKEVHNSHYCEDELTNTIVLAPAPLLGFLFAVVIYCDIVIFWSPNTRLYEKGGLPWQGGEMNAVEAWLPLILSALYVAAISYANTLQISFSMFERQFVIEIEVLTSLQGREVVLGKDGIGALCRVNTGTGLPFVRRSIVKKMRWYLQEGKESLPADLYANFINSLAASSCVKDYKASSMTSFANVVLPLIVALSPMSARVFNGGSVWGKGLAEEFALAICGPLMSFVCVYGIMAMLNLFAFTMKFHRRRMYWLTLALPDPTRPQETSFPPIPFDCMENVLIWHRIRSAIAKPPAALYTWGRRLSEITFALFVVFVLLSIIYNLINKAPSIFDGSTALTIALLVTLAPVLLYIYYTPLKATFLEGEHAEVLCRVLLLSLKGIAQERGAVGLSDETIQKMYEIRSSIKVVAKSVASEQRLLTFLGFPLTVYTMLGIILFFGATTALVVMRGVYANEPFI